MSGAVEIKGTASQLRFSLRRKFMVAEWLREGKAPVLLAAIRPGLVSNEQARAIWYQAVDALLKVRLASIGIILEDEEGLSDAGD